MKLLDKMLTPMGGTWYLTLSDTALKEPSILQSNCKGEEGEASIIEYSQNEAHKVEPQLCPVNLVNGFMKCHLHFFLYLVIYNRDYSPLVFKSMVKTRTVNPNCSFYGGLDGWFWTSNYLLSQLMSPMRKFLFCCNQNIWFWTKKVTFV